MQNEIYNLSQWHWAADRVAEGYKLNEVAEFLGIYHKNLVQGLVKIGRRLEPKDRVPLDKRKSEFISLKDDGSPLRCECVPVIGTDRNGNQKRWSSMTAAAKELGVTYPASILHAIKYNHRCRGWRFEREDEL